MSNNQVGKWSINEWRERYEVNDKGQPARLGDKLRAGPIRYIRSKVWGRSRGEGWQILLDLCQDQPLDVDQAPISQCFECFGVFEKLLEIAADQEANARGRLPSIDRLSRILGYKHQLKPRLEKILQTLGHKDLAWLVPGDSQNIPEKPGNARLNETKRNLTHKQLNADQEEQNPEISKPELVSLRQTEPIPTARAQQERFTLEIYSILASELPDRDKGQVNADKTDVSKLAIKTRQTAPNNNILESRYAQDMADLETILADPRTRNAVPRWLSSRK